jgi:hypothetical protein
MRRRVDFPRNSPTRGYLGGTDKPAGSAITEYPIGNRRAFVVKVLLQEKGRHSGQHSVWGHGFGASKSLSATTFQR